MGGVFHNTQIAIPIRRLLIALGHPQPPTPIKTDNTTAQTFITDNITPRRSKPWDMRYHNLRDKRDMEQFNYYWKEGRDNDADPFTKHFFPSQHRVLRPRFVRDCFTEAINNIIPMG